MQQVEVVSFHPSVNRLFQVVFTPNTGMLRKDRELQAVGCVLTKITTLAEFTPVSYHKLSPAFVYKNDIVLGESYWDPERDGGTITVTPVRKQRKKT